MENIYKISLKKINGHLDCDRHTINDGEFIREFEKREEGVYKGNIKDVVSLDLETGLTVMILSVARMYLKRKINGEYGKTNLKYSDFSFDFNIIEYKNYLDTPDKIIPFKNVFASWDSNNVYEKTLIEKTTNLIMKGLDINDDAIDKL